MNIKDIVIAGLAVLALLVSGVVFLNRSVPTPGQATGPQHYQEEAFLQGLQIGQRGSDIKNVNAGKCTLIGLTANIAASTTVPFDCAVTGALTGDTVIGMFATSSPNGAGWEIVGASASTTAGYLTFRITNGTGASAYPPASIASTTQYIDLR